MGTVKVHIIFEHNYMDSSEVSDQLVQMYKLIWDFAVYVKNHRLL